MAQALLPDWDTCAAVRVANLTTQPFILTAEMEVGHSSLATGLDALSEHSSTLDDHTVTDNVVTSH